MDKRFSNQIEGFATISDILRWRASHQPDKTVFTFLSENEGQELNLTFKELDRKARAIAAGLQRRNLRNERALLLHPSGLEFIAGFFGCLYAGVVAIPTYPPLPKQSERRLQALLDDAQPRAILSTARMRSDLNRRSGLAGAFNTLTWLDTDDVDLDQADECGELQSNQSALAFIQYTSGSTNAPKGVMVNHNSLLYNSRMMQRAFQHTDQSIFAGWLPMYHDMGLVGYVIQPVCAGARSILMSPAAFLQKPFRWLQAISFYKAQTSGGPNFAYDFCVRKITPEQRSSLDLRCWTIALNGAEPVRHETLERFAEYFEPCGFRKEAFYPCYGLAEATLFVSGGKKTEAPVINSFKSSSLEQNRAYQSTLDEENSRVLVSCGQTQLDQRIVIVDPESLLRCPDDQIGEIWVSGPNVAQGYWNRQQESKRTFQARIADTGEGPFLRTGDLGFLTSAGQLFVTGRLKDLIIIHGRNHFPSDIESAVECAHPALCSGGSAAFSAQVSGEERLVIVAEVERHTKASEIEAAINAIKRQLAEHHQLEAYSVALVRKASIPKTTSGKIQRHLCRSRFLDGSLKVVSAWTMPIAPLVEHSSHLSSGDARSTEAIRQQLVSLISKQVRVHPESIDVGQHLSTFGLDSVAAINLTGELGEWLNRKISPTLVYEHPTIEALSKHLAGEIKAAHPHDWQPEHEANEQAADNEPVAIIGISCRFPGASSPEAFWQLLRDGIDAITEVPSKRWDAQIFYSPGGNRPGTMNTASGGFLEDIDKFDAAYFNIPPREAAQMDPQQRLLLELACEALQDAGLVPEQLAGARAGVFIGISGSDYGAMLMNDPAAVEAYAVPGNALSIAANRISYVFDFRGPSLAIDTACSSSLVAAHLACRSIRAGDCSVALAGGVNMILSPSVTISFAHGMATSPDGRCKAFDASANGMVRSEGAGLVVLKPLSKALSDGDHVYAVIRGSAINQDGRTNGLTAPSRFAQEAVLREAYRAAGVEAAQVQYVEAHGTGTLLGDPIEAEALGSVLAEGRAKDRPCAIGSVKTNLGHLEAAAGIASLIKVALSLERKMIPPSLHFHEPNPHIPFDRLPLRVQQSLDCWPDYSQPGLAGVSAFGFGGVNAHVVLEGPQTNALSQRVEKEVGSDFVHLLTLSARSPEALRSLAHSYKELLADGTGTSLRDICYSASVRRSHHACRLAIAARTSENFIERIDAFLNDEPRRNMAYGQAIASARPKLVFVFSGYGSQWWAMGRKLIEQEPVFKSALMNCERLLCQHADWSLLEELMADEAHSRLGGDNVEITQVALVAIQIALAELWRSWGVEPGAVVGHSLGEIPAAYVAGALSLKDAIRVCFTRARLMQSKAPYESGHGAMAVAELSIEEASNAIAGYENSLSIAARNSPNSIVLSGDATAIEQVLEELRKRNIFCRTLRAPGAGHSPQVEDVKQGLSMALKGLECGPSSIPIFSTVTGRRIDDEKLDAQYWGRNIRDTVLFAEAIDSAIDTGYDTFLELSPHPILAAPLSQCLFHRNQQGTVLPSLKRNEEERMTMLGSLGALYVSGYPVEWARLRQPGGHYVRLPLYPWQRESYWLDTAEDRSFDAERSWKNKSRPNSHPFLSRHFAPANSSGAHCWEFEPDERFFPYLEDHKVNGGVLLPGTAYIEMALAAATEVFGAGAFRLTGVEFLKALFLSQGRRQTVQVILIPEAKGEAAFRIYSRAAADKSINHRWALNARGRICREDAKAGDLRPVQEIQSRLPEEIDGRDYYRQLQAGGLCYGPHFQGIERIWRRDGEALGWLRVPPELNHGAQQYHYHPAILDACLQVLGAAVPAHLIQGEKAVAGLPTQMALVRIYDRPCLNMRSHACLKSPGNGSYNNLEGDIRLYDTEGRLLAEISGFRLQLFNSIAERPGDGDFEKWLYELQWQNKERAEEKLACDPVASTAGSWLIFEDSHGTGQALAAQLNEAGERAVLISEGETYKATDQDRFQIRDDQPEDLKQLLDDAVGPGQPPVAGVIHLRSLNSPSSENLDLASLEKAQAAGCGFALNLVHELSCRRWEKAPRLWLVTSGAQLAQADSVAGLAQSALWGLGRAIAGEHSDLWGGLIDLDGNSQPQELAALILKEIRTPDGEDQLAFRSGHRYVARLARKGELDERERALRPQANGSYLITGGLGELGLAVARWLVEHGARRLILLSRTSLPPRTNWNDAQPQARLAGQIAAVRELESLGASVHLAPVDVADEAQLASFLDQYRQEGYPPVRGIVHAAGIVDLQTLAELDHDKLKAVLRPKVNGGWLLHKLTAAMPLDFFVLFSSFSSLLSSPRLGHYAAANSFLDALAHHRRSLGLPALSINWGAWGKIGMATRFIEAGRQPLEGLRSFSPDEALEIMGSLMSQDFAQIGVMRVDWNKWRSLYPFFTQSPLLSRITSEEAEAVGQAGGLQSKTSAIRDLIFAAQPRDRNTILEDYIRDLVARSLRMSPAKISTQQPLNSLGIDSLTAIEVKRRVESDLGVIVPVVSLLQGPSIAQLAQQVLDELKPDAGIESGLKPGDDDCTQAVIDQLSEQQVDALLREMLASEKQQQPEGADLR